MPEKPPLLAVGLSAIHKAHLAAALGAETGRPVFVLTDDDNPANRFASDLHAFSEKPVTVLPARDLVMADVAGVSRGYEQKRLAALDGLPEARFAVASVQAAALRTLPPDALGSASVTIRTGQEAPLDGLAQELTRAGYERCTQVEGAGQFSVRGGILDVFPPQAEHPFAWNSGTTRSIQSQPLTWVANGGWTRRRLCAVAVHGDTARAGQGRRGGAGKGCVGSALHPPQKASRPGGQPGTRRGAPARDRRTARSGQVPAARLSGARVRVRLPAGKRACAH